MPIEGHFAVSPGTKDFGLIPFEKQIIALTVAGYSREETAKSIGISQPALGRYMKGICGKLGVSNPFELVLFAIYHQLNDTADLPSSSG